MLHAVKYGIRESISQMARFCLVKHTSHESISQIDRCCPVKHLSRDLISQTPRLCMGYRTAVMNSLAKWLDEAMWNIPVTNQSQTSHKPFKKKPHAFLRFHQPQQQPVHSYMQPHPAIAVIPPNTSTGNPHPQHAIKSHGHSYNTIVNNQVQPTELQAAIL